MKSPNSSDRPLDISVIAKPTLLPKSFSISSTRILKLSFVLFDEIEKASDVVWNLLLGILDRATLTLGDNRKVDFSNALIFMTSNMDAAEIRSLVGPQLVSRAGIPAARRKFTPEFLNRLDKIVVFRPLTFFRETDTWETGIAKWVAAA